MVAKVSRAWFCFLRVRCVKWSPTKLATSNFHQQPFLQTKQKAYFRNVCHDLDLTDISTSESYPKFGDLGDTAQTGARIRVQFLLKLLGHWTLG